MFLLKPYQEGKKRVQLLVGVIQIMKETPKAGKCLFWPIKQFFFKIFQYIKLKMGFNLTLNHIDWKKLIINGISIQQV